jgi:hypothetical protein
MPPDQPIVIALVTLIGHRTHAVPIAGSLSAAMKRICSFFAEQSLSRGAGCNIAA